ncbi:OLC1v1007517C1 [Oldenlandia corymbosa var. corymbosa]|uniref:OLC1v1007517C1 n=1 Tax=Oldenlandia corymbosa var. corymbosa TaxID=529605 RepID=A0AAV1DM24_OLDCO|nr:OLC1v1007517C1 [Oldenlandia corymbosa var. corymbosa]
MARPLLLITRSLCSAKLYEVGQDKIFNHEFQLPRTKSGRYYCGSSYGWLITHRHGKSIKLINPLTEEMIKIDSTIRTSFNKAILSRTPTISASSQEKDGFYLGGICNFGGKAQLDGLLYALDENNRIVAFDYNSSVGICCLCKKFLIILMRIFHASFMCTS